MPHRNIPISRRKEGSQVASEVIVAAIKLRGSPGTPVFSTSRITRAGDHIREKAPCRTEKGPFATGALWNKEDQLASRHPE